LARPNDSGRKKSRFSGNMPEKAERNRKEEEKDFLPLFL